MQPKVSVIIPAYNCERFIGKCIESVCNQTYQNIEILIINDGSKDNTKNIINSFVNKDYRIVYIEQKNSGPSTARNTGLDNANGEYVIFVDSDDTISENYVEYLLNSILIEKCDLVCCGYIDISTYGQLKYSDFIDNSNCVKKESVLTNVCKGTGGVLWGKIFKKDIIDLHNIRMNKDIYMCEDLIFVLQYVSHCKSFKYLNEFLYHYNRLNTNSISSNISKGYLHNYIEVCKHIELILLSNDIEKDCVEQIISDRIQGIVITIIDSEVRRSRKLKETYTNIKDLLSDKYIQLYKTTFKANNKLSKPYILFIKNNKIYCCITYSYMLSLVRKIKHCIK